MVGAVPPLRELVRSLADVNKETSFGRTALISAVMCKQQQCILNLLSLKAVPEKMTSSGQSAVICAQSMKNIEALKVLQPATQPGS